MKPITFIEQAERDAKIVDAIHYARYALVRYHSLPVTMEGEQFDMDFSLEIAKLTEAMELLGIDTSNGLIAPPFPDEREGSPVTMPPLPKMTRSCSSATIWPPRSSLTTRSSAMRSSSIKRNTSRPCWTSSRTSTFPQGGGGTLAP